MTEPKWIITSETVECPWEQVIDNRKWYKPWTWRKRYPNYYFVDGDGERINMERFVQDVVERIKKET